MTGLILSDKQRRVALADRIKTMGDVELPVLDAWNYEACEHHKDVGPQVDCAWQTCGGELFSHQKVTTAWMYAIQHGILGSEPGTGKTNSIIALLAMLKQQGKLVNRALLIPNTPAVKQWYAELSRWAPGLNSILVTSELHKDERIDKYASEWDVLVVGQHIANNDREFLERLAPFTVVASDDVDPLLNHKNRAHRTIRELSKEAEYSFTVNGTVIQTSLTQLHAALTPAGGYNLLGSLKAFQDRYERREMVAGHRATTGYKNIDELKEKISHVHIKYRADELDDVRLPEIMPPVTEWLEMSPPQRERYTELQQGVMRMIKEEGVSVTKVNALQRFLRGQQICAGLPALGEPDGPGASPKLDKLFYNLDTVWRDRKVIVFVKNVGTVRAAVMRAKEQGINPALVWGQGQNNDQRQEQVQKFWQDDSCRLLLGTTSLERSLNLQCSNTVVLLDTHLNPARVSQIVGRARRAGSRHDHIFVFKYYMYGTQEERYERVLAERAALAEAVLSDESVLFERLSPMELLRLIQP